MQIQDNDTLYFKIIAPELVGDIKLGSNIKIRGKLALEVPSGLLAYLDRPRQSIRAEYLASQGHDVNNMSENVGILRFVKQQVPELGLINSGSQGQNFKVCPLIYNPELEVTKEEFIEGINWLVKELATPAKRALYHGTLIYHVAHNLSLVPIRSTIELVGLPAAAKSPIGKKKVENGD